MPVLLLELHCFSSEAQWNMLLGICISMQKASVYMEVLWLVVSPRSLVMENFIPLWASTQKLYIFREKCCNFPFESLSRWSS